MKNITLKIDDETYHKARVRAAQEGISVSALVRYFLNNYALTEDQESAHKRHVAALDKLFAKADKKSQSNKKPIKPLTRKEIYGERIR